MGAGQWKGDHFVALSITAYLKPLKYFLEMELLKEERNLSDQAFSDVMTETAYNLIMYFDNKIKIGGLLKIIQQIKG